MRCWTIMHMRRCASRAQRVPLLACPAVQFEHEVVMAPRLWDRPDCNLPRAIPVIASHCWASQQCHPSVRLALCEQAGTPLRHDGRGSAA